MYNLLVVLIPLQYICHANHALHIPCQSIIMFSTFRADTRDPRGDYYYADIWAHTSRPKLTSTVIRCSRCGRESVHLMTPTCWEVVYWSKTTPSWCLRSVNYYFVIESHVLRPRASVRIPCHVILFFWAIPTQWLLHELWFWIKKLMILTIPNNHIHVECVLSWAIWLRLKACRNLSG